MARSAVSHLLPTLRSLNDQQLSITDNLAKSNSMTTITSTADASHNENRCFTFYKSERKMFSASDVPSRSTIDKPVPMKTNSMTSSALPSALLYENNCFSFYRKDSIKSEENVFNPSTPNTPSRSTFINGSVKKEDMTPCTSSDASQYEKSCFSFYIKDAIKSENNVDNTSTSCTPSRSTCIDKSIKTKIETPINVSHHKSSCFNFYRLDARKFEDVMINAFSKETSKKSSSSNQGLFSFHVQKRGTNAEKESKSRPKQTRKKNPKKKTCQSIDNDLVPQAEAKELGQFSQTENEKVLTGHEDSDQASQTDKKKISVEDEKSEKVLQTENKALTGDEELDNLLLTIDDFLDS